MKDEYYTTSDAIEPIIKYIDRSKIKTILAPFDTKDSNYVKILKREGFKVVYTHISTGKDFFTYTKEELEGIDMIISNPPFSRQWEIIAKCYELDKPFMLLIKYNGMFESIAKREMFRDKLQLLILNKKCRYMKDYAKPNELYQIPFTSYIAYNILKRDIVIEAGEENGTTK